MYNDDPAITKTQRPGSRQFYRGRGPATSMGLGNDSTSVGWVAAGDSLNYNASQDLSMHEIEVSQQQASKAGKGDSTSDLTASTRPTSHVVAGLYGLKNGYMSGTNRQSEGTFGNRNTQGSSHSIG